MPSLIVQPAGNKNAQQHYIDTVLNPVSLSVVSQYVDAPTLGRLKELYPGNEMPVWGFTPGTNNGNLAKWNRIQQGDVALFLRNKSAFASAVITLKIHNHHLAARLWDYDANGTTWEYVYFLDEVQSQNVPYERLNTLLGYEPKNNFQQALVLADEKSEPVITELELQSDTYDIAPSHEEYLEALEPTENIALDKEIRSKARTEQSYLRSVNFKDKKYAECGICHREFPIGFLVAAHIKKRSECSDQEKRDYNNITMPMCKFGCDDLYEKGYIGVNEKITIVHDENLSATVREYLDAIEGNDCKYWNDATKIYFDWHNTRLRLAG